MAFILLKNRKTKFVSPEQGATMWRIMNNEIKGSKAQRQFVSQIAGLYLNPSNAPKSYLQMISSKKRENTKQVRLPYADH